MKANEIIKIFNKIPARNILAEFERQYDPYIPNNLNRYINTLTENDVDYSIKNEIMRLKDVDNQGLIMGHGITNPNEVCLIPDNLALFFYTPKNTYLSNKDVDYKLLRNKSDRRQIVNRKLRHKTGKLFPANTSILDMDVRFASVYNIDGNEAGSMNQTVSYGHSGIITGDLSNLEGLSQINRLDYENKLQKIRTGELAVSGSFLEYNGVHKITEFSNLYNPNVFKNLLEKGKNIYKLTPDECERVRGDNRNLLRDIKTDSIKNHDFTIISNPWNKTYKLSTILKFISRARRDNGRLPELYHIILCRSFAPNLYDVENIHLAPPSLKRENSYSPNSVKMCFNFCHKVYHQFKKIYNSNILSPLENKKLEKTCMLLFGEFTFNYTIPIYKQGW